jgi:hypothetical protein
MECQVTHQSLHDINGSKIKNPGETTTIFLKDQYETIQAKSRKQQKAKGTH